MREETQALLDQLDKTDYSWDWYSGRGMMGKSCIGITLEKVTDLFELGQHFHDLYIGPPSTDNMGKGIIAYWPIAQRY